MFNALAHYQLEPKDIRDCYDTMYVCFEKGLCCPVGGAILGSKSDI
jgi:threonine aldolase